MPINQLHSIEYVDIHHGSMNIKDLGEFIFFCVERSILIIIE